MSTGRNTNCARVLDLRYASSIKSCEELREKGYEPIGAKYKTGSDFKWVVGELKLGMRDKPLISRAVELGCLGRVVKLCSPAAPAPDITLAMALLSGYASKKLAQLVIDNYDEPGPQMHGLLTLHDLTIRSYPHQLPYQAGVHFWHMMSSKYEEPIYQQLFDSIHKLETERVSSAEKAVEEGELTGPVLLVKSDLWGFDVWYKYAELVIQYLPERKRILIGVRDKDAVKKYFPYGLNRFLKDNFGPGWGGRTYIGGSPVGMDLEYADAVDVRNALLLYLAI